MDVNLKTAPIFWLGVLKKVVLIEFMNTCNAFALLHSFLKLRHGDNKMLTECEHLMIISLAPSTPLSPFY